MKRDLADRNPVSMDGSTDDARVLTVVGLGPGDESFMTSECIESLRGADIIVGYPTYTAFVKRIFPDKRYFETGMTHESLRCATAIELAEKGQNVCLVSGGDSGVYGMAGLAIETAFGTGVRVRVVAGVTAATSGAAALGAPLGHDFAVVSLSDLLTPQETIIRRLRAAAAGDFCICLYNAGGTNRAEFFASSCEVLLELLPHDRICGLAKNIGRPPNEEILLLVLRDLMNAPVDMSTTVFIGNSKTRVVDGRMVTPRGYGERV